MELPQLEVSVSGRLENPRYLWICDRVGQMMRDDPDVYGLHADDQLACFASGTFSNVEAFLRKNKDNIIGVQAIIFLMIGMDELAIDAPPGPLSQVAEGYFHPLGPRQFPAENGVEVVTGGDGEVKTSRRHLRSEMGITKNTRFQSLLQFTL